MDQKHEQFPTLVLLSFITKGPVCKKRTSKEEVGNLGLFVSFQNFYHTVKWIFRSMYFWQKYPVLAKIPHKKQVKQQTTNGEGW